MKRLSIKKSRIKGAGFGLFTMVPIAKGKRIAFYSGKLVRWRDIKKEDGHNPYILRVNRVWAINALHAKNTYGRYANDARGLTRVRGLANNADYVVDGLRCFIEARRNIRAKEEILVAYGAEFWALIKKLQKNKKNPAKAGAPA